MAHSDQRSSDIKTEVAEFRSLMRAAGLRCTSARLAVLQHLRQADSPITHAELAEELVPFGFDKDTIFRNLTDLTEAGLLSRNELGDHVWPFEIRDPDDPHEGNHPHFVCIDCGKVACFCSSLLPYPLSANLRIGRLVTVGLLDGPSEPHTNQQGDGKSQAVVRMQFQLRQ
ncbi:MAG: transcriptional repressor [Planctomycetaceae bacterium]|nr:transcriptional repressor [Planctomycetaceae bacterium]